MADDDSADEEDLVGDLSSFGQGASEGAEVEEDDGEFASFEELDDAEAELDDLASPDELEAAEAELTLGEEDNPAKKQKSAPQKKEKTDFTEEEDELMNWDGDEMEAAMATIETDAKKQKSAPQKKEKKNGTEEEDELLCWDGDEMEAAMATVETDDIFEKFNFENDETEAHEDRLLARLRKDFGQLWPGQHSFALEPFGSFVTGLGLTDTGDGGRSDLDVVLLFHGSPPDSFSNDVRSRLVTPTIERLGSWLRKQQGITVKEVIKRARVPIVMFETKELSVDISVQQPFGPMNSWHVRDLCKSGWPGRLQALVRLIKRWAKSKSIHTAKDGSLSSYGWGMLAASYLQYVGILPALLPEKGGDSNPYIGPDECLADVLRAAKHGQRQSKFWKAPEPLEVDMTSEFANSTPEDLFFGWIEWMTHCVLGHLGETDKPAASGRLPLEKRHIVSVRPRSQEQLVTDVTWCEKHKEHWAPHLQEVHLLIEEPMTGENVSRGVRGDGFQAIHAEIQRALEFLGTPPNNLKALLELSPLRSARTGIWETPRGTKRPAPDTGVPPGKRRAVSSSSLTGTIAEWKGKFGWIRPDSPVEGARQDGLVYVTLDDVENKRPLTPDTQVSFSVYADHRGIGAEKVRAVGGGQTANAPWQASDAKGGAKGAASKGPIAPGAKFSKGGKWNDSKGGKWNDTIGAKFSKGAPWKDAKAAGKASVATTGGSKVRSKQELQDELKNVKARKAQAIEEEDFTAAQAFKSREKEIQAELEYAEANGAPDDSVAKASKPSDSKGKGKGKGKSKTKEYTEDPELDDTEANEASVDSEAKANKQSDSKGKGKAKGKIKPKEYAERGPPGPRERITEEAVEGIVLEWKGPYGWIKPSEPIDHPAAAQNRGRIYANFKDIWSGENELNEGDMVQFHVFADNAGLGAEKVQFLGESGE